ncbi:polysaccharide biosynthesis C-terminal domain-containing protein [Pseudoalteromonas piscicida]|uniref:oligosaccharide flippase family protein n=1 Tax=Pseudoalteromonas piscicida TaxID=43662 RepID=UPI0005FA89F8|nr:polysaccharide biosynthesis C-terminal domain-containing protein [Pseudoalteromonas piscicida]KJZ04355.1 hypothetical protein TW73_04115 [Pseudoalteromonas piscicida]
MKSTDATIRVASLTVVSIAITFLIQGILTRWLDVAAYGDVTVALTLCSLLGTVITFGLNDFYLKIASEKSGCSKEMRLRMLKIHSLAFLIIFSITSIILYFYGMLHLAIFLGVVYSHGAFLFLNSVLQVNGNYNALSFVQIIQPTLRLLFLMGIFLVWGASVTSVASAYLAVSIITIAIGYSIFYRAESSKFTIYSDWELLKNSIPFSFAILMHLVYFQSDLLLLRVIVGAETVAYYNVAFLIVSSVYILPGIYYQKIMLAKLHRWFSSNEQSRINAFEKLRFKTFLIGSVCSVAVMVGSYVFIPLVFGADYSDSLVLVYCLAIAIPIRFLSCNYGALLMVKNNINIKVKCMGWTAVLNVTLNLVTIPLYGAVGAAISTVLSEVALCFLYKKYSSEFMRTIFKLNKEVNGESIL